MPNPERKHHSCSPSTLHMREVCPIWAPTGESNEKAELGTRQHKVVEDRADDDTLSDEEMLAALECVEYAEATKERIARRWGVEEIKEPYLQVDKCRLFFPFYDPKTFTTRETIESTTTGGYADLLLVVPGLKHVEIFDWKFGRWEVTDAKENIQGICYVLGVFREYKWCKTVRLHFKQPAIGKVSTHVFRRDEAPRLLLKVRTLVERAAARGKSEQPYKFAVPNIPACLFCARRGECHKLHEIVLDVAKGYYPVEFPADLSPMFLRDPADFSKGLRLAQVVEAWAKGYKTQGTQQVLLKQVPPPDGYEIKEYSCREIVDRDKYQAAALDAGVSMEQFLGTLKPSLGSVEKLISDQQPRGSKTEAIRIFREAVEEVGAVAKSQPTYYLGVIPKKTENKNKQKDE